MICLPDMDAHLALKMGNVRRHVELGPVMNAQIYQLSIRSRTPPYGFFRSSFLTVL